jgi:hypothetical protein
MGQTLGDVSGGSSSYGNNGFSYGNNGVSYGNNGVSYGNNGASFNTGKTPVCETLNLFLLRDTAITNMMATQFTAEQKMQIQNYMNVIDSYIKYMQRNNPTEAANWVRSANDKTRNGMVDTVVLYARQTAASQPEAQRVVTAAQPVVNNPSMMAYMQAMLMNSDMSDAYHSCNGSIISR